MACSLPQFILLKSMKKEKYLRYRKEDDSNHAFLQFSGDEKVEKPDIQYVKFEVQKSETMEGFVNIRSCYNNKYWVRKSGVDESKSYIVVEGNEPQEDPSQLSCTLFKPVLVEVDMEQDGEFVEHDKPQKIRLFHIDQVGQQGCVAPPDSDLLTLQGHVDDDDDVFTVYNADSFIILPHHIALVNHNGKYGAFTTQNGWTYVDFKTNDIGLDGVAIDIHQYISANPPYITFQYIPSNVWWMLPNNVIRVIASTAYSEHLRLTPILLGGNNISFRVTKNPTRFANSGSFGGLPNVLGCTATSINESAIFGVKEPVLLRQVSNVEYKLSDSRVYNISSVDKFRDERKNNTSVEQIGSFSVEYAMSETTNWSDSVSVTTGMSASMSASIPSVGVGFGVELSQESNKTVEFGKEQVESNEVKYQQSVTIPPGKKVTLLVVASRAQCDVPFSCRVIDTLTNGTVENYAKTDGLFTGANEFNFQTELLEEDI